MGAGAGWVFRDLAVRPVLEPFLLCSFLSKVLLLMEVVSIHCSTVWVEP